MVTDSDRRRFHLFAYNFCLCV